MQIDIEKVKFVVDEIFKLLNDTEINQREMNIIAGEVNAYNIKYLIDGKLENLDLKVIRK